MQVHGPREVYDASEIRARLNGDFAVMKIGHVELFIYTPEECDALIKAAAEAKRLLSPPVITEPAPDDDWESGEDATVAIAESSEAERAIYPCCDHCTPQCSALGFSRTGHTKPCTTPGCVAKLPESVSA